MDRRDINKNSRFNMEELKSEGAVVKPTEKENFSTVKQWLFSKLQIPYLEPSIDNSLENAPKSDTQDPSQGGGKVPTIIISRGSDKSINTLGRTPPIRKQSPLLKSYSDTTGVQIGKQKQLVEAASFENSPKLCSSVASTPGTRLRKHKSEPSTPIDGKARSRFTSHSQNSAKARFLSPVFRFSLKESLTNSSASVTRHDSEESFASSDNDSPRSISNKFYFQEVKEEEKIESMDLTAKQARVPDRKLTLRRTSSCGAQVNRSYSRPAAPISKAISQTDFHNHNSGKKSQSGKLKCGRRAGSKEKARSTICLTRSISINLDMFRVRRSSKSGPSDRKLSLANNEELCRAYERRRSSLLRLLCNNAPSEDTTDGQADSSSDSSSRNLPEFSPKVTRPLFIGSLKKIGGPLDDFRSTFESETRDVPSIFGQVKVMFQYMTKRKQLEVTLLRGCNLASNINGTLGIYAKICLMPGKKQKQRSENRLNTHDPSFQDLFCFRLSLDEVLESRLRLKFYDKPGIFSMSVPLGECYVELYNYDLTAVTVIWLNLNRSKGQKCGEEEFDFSLIEKNTRQQKRGIGNIFKACSRN